METPFGRRDREDGPVRSVLVAIGLTVFGLVGAEFATTPAILLDPTLATAPGEVSIEVRTLFMVLNFVGMALAGAIYLAVTDRGWSYVDLRPPTKRGWLYIGIGVVASIAYLIFINVLITALSLQSAQSGVIDILGNDQTMILIMIAIVFFFNAPAEEFLFRNVIQKRLYEAFSRISAVIVASTIFALVHFPIYALTTDSLAAVATSLSILFGGSVIFGYLYAKSENLAVPIGAHATLNAVQFGLLYLSLEYDLEAAEPPTSAVVDLATALL
ncbi:CPBP family intramembrane glutamic endopeptidase [Halopiger thermotolerans]